MNVIINQQSKDIPEQCSLQELITQVLGIAPDGLAIAVGQEIIPQTRWSEHVLQASDKVMLIRATQGG